jgi:DNA-binding NtrC family response regulator
MSLNENVLVIDDCVDSKTKTIKTILRSGLKGDFFGGDSLEDIKDGISKFEINLIFIKAEYFNDCEVEKIREELSYISDKRPFIIYSEEENSLELARLNTCHLYDYVNLSHDTPFLRDKIDQILKTRR